MRRAGPAAPAVLVIGADAAACAALTAAVARAAPGSRVTSVEAGGEGLDAALAGLLAFTLVAVDVEATAAGTLAERLRAGPATRGATLVALTSGMRPDTLIEAETSGFSAFVFTPPDADGLDRVLPRLLGLASPEIPLSGRME